MFACVGVRSGRPQPPVHASTCVHACMREREEERERLRERGRETERERLSDNGDPLNGIVYCLNCESRSSHGVGDLQECFKGQ